MSLTGRVYNTSRGEEGACWCSVHILVYCNDFDVVKDDLGIACCSSHTWLAVDRSWATKVPHQGYVCGS